MGKLSRAAGAAGRGTLRRVAGAAGRGTLRRAAGAAGREMLRLVAGGRRDWTEAIWAQAHEVPPGWPRLAWRAGGVGLIAREAMLPRRLVRAALFAVAAVLAAWAAWPQPGIRHVTESRFHVIATVLLLALAPRFFGPASPGRAGRFLRVFCCTAILAYLPTSAIIGAFRGLVPRRAYQRLYGAPPGCLVRRPEVRTGQARS